MRHADHMLLFKFSLMKHCTIRLLLLRHLTTPIHQKWHALFKYLWWDMLLFKGNEACHCSKSSNEAYRYSHCHTIKSDGSHGGQGSTGQRRRMKRLQYVGEKNQFTLIKKQKSRRASRWKPLGPSRCSHVVGKSHAPKTKRGGSLIGLRGSVTASLFLFLFPRIPWSK